MQKQNELRMLDLEIAKRRKEMKLLELDTQKARMSAAAIDKRFDANDVDFGVNTDSEQEAQREIEMRASLGYEKHLDKESLEGTYYRLPEKEAVAPGADAGFLSAVSKEDLAQAVRETKAIGPIKNGLKGYFAKKLVGDMR